MTDGLKDKHRAAIVAAIAANDRVERAVLFGSRATGTNTATSDVDIALFGDLLTLTDQAYLAAALDEIPMAQSVDLLLYDSIQSRILREHIRRQGIEWYARPPREEGDDTASDSGAEWPVVKLEEVSSDEPGAIAMGPFGSRMKSDVYTLSGVPVIRGTNISTSRAWRNEWVYVSDDFADGLPNCNVREGDLVFPHRGSIGEVAIIPGDRDRYMLSTSLMKFRPDPDKVSPLFLFYYFRSDTGRSEIMQYSSQVGTPGIGQPLTSLRQFQVPIPPREEQERVADILSTLDDKIELNRQMNQTLEEVARALFKSWFVDFDPVRAKATLKQCDPTPSQGRSDWSVKRARAFLDRMDPNIAALFPDSFVDSELGPIPEGWEVKALRECFEVERGLSYKGSALSSFGVPMHNLNSILEGGGYKNDGIKYYSGGYRPRHVVKPGDVIVANTEQGHDRLLIGFAAIVPKCFGDNGLFSHHIYRVRIRSSFASAPDFVCRLLNTQAIHDTVSGYATGTTVNMLPVDALRIPRFVAPSPQVVTTFRAIAEEARIRQETFIAESYSLATLRDALLPKLISGKNRLLVP